MPPGWSKSYDEQGFLIIPTPTAAADAAINGKARAEEVVEKASASRAVLAQTASAGAAQATAAGGGTCLRASTALVGFVAGLVALL